MWFVMQTLGGEEEKTADMIKKLVSPNFFEDCFVPKRERLKKFHGSWNKVEEVLFHGYAFIVSERPGGLYEELKRIPKLAKMLGRETDYFFALGEKEERLVREIGGKEHKVALSRIAIGEGRRIQVIDGPLKGYAGYIAKMNLHKREAIVRMEFMRRPLELKMGIEMVEMKDSADGLMDDSCAKYHECVR